MKISNSVGSYLATQDNQHPDLSLTCDDDTTRASENRTTMKISALLPSQQSSILGDLDIDVGCGDERLDQQLFYAKPWRRKGETTGKQEARGIMCQVHDTVVSALGQ